MRHDPIIVTTSTWHDNTEVRAILAEIVCDPPRYAAVALPDILTGRPVYQYDRSDIRVARLEGFACGWFAATESFDLTVDEVIAKARAEYRLKEAEEARVAAFLDDGFCLGEARSMASDPAASNDLPDMELRA